MFLGVRNSTLLSRYRWMPIAAEFLGPQTSLFGVPNGRCCSDPIEAALNIVINMVYGIKPTMSCSLQERRLTLQPRAVSGPGEILLLSLSRGLGLPHLGLRLSGPGAHVRDVSFFALGAVPVRAAVPVLDGLPAETRSPHSTRPVESTVRTSVLPALVGLPVGVLVPLVQLGAVAVVAAGALGDGFGTARGSGSTEGKR